MKLVLRHACSSRGAEMGRRNWVPIDDATSVKLRMERLKWVDGDYDEWGAYWGNGKEEYIYCAWTEKEFPCRQDDYTETPVNHRIEIFVREANRDAAKDELKQILPGAKFYV